MEFGQVIEYKIRNCFIQKSGITCGKEKCSRPTLVFLKKALHEVKASGLQLSFNVFQ